MKDIINILKNKFVLLGILVILLVGTTVLFLSFQKREKVATITPTKEVVSEESDALDELLNQEIDESKHDLKLAIISPDVEKILPGQARMYNALATGNAKYSTTVNCNWEFFLNENNKEVLYKQQATRGVLSGEEKEICGFTSTFMDRVGKLRVVLTMTVYNAINDNLETVKAERMYVVSK